jgi:hypothetical protein
MILSISCKNEEMKVENKNIATFKFLISDTLAYGRNLARISEYKRDYKENQSSVIAVIIKNEFPDGTIKNDTFSDGLKTPFFGIGVFQTGKQQIEVKVEEKVMTDKKLSNDSMILEINDIYYTYVFDVFVKEKGYKSELNSFLSKQMEIEYAEHPITK